ncbi:MAG: hypothetical protein A4E57_04907 [Syntrophorhabdaceae bacterium PtaU1.Bin034]|nr:MAG: hypothetical protein A4E57_04907 [Syntrophorhabdaceae bacterium PtaU1.Bin034]
MEAFRFVGVFQKCLLVCLLEGLAEFRPVVVPGLADPPVYLLDVSRGYVQSFLEVFDALLLIGNMAFIHSDSRPKLDLLPVICFFQPVEPFKVVPQPCELDHPLIAGGKSSRHLVLT